MADQNLKEVLGKTVFDKSENAQEKAQKVEYFTKAFPNAIDLTDPNIYYIEYELRHGAKGDRARFTFYDLELEELESFEIGLSASSGTRSHNRSIQAQESDTIEVSLSYGDMIGKIATHEGKDFCFTSFLLELLAKWKDRTLYAYLNQKIQACEGLEDLPF